MVKANHRSAKHKRGSFRETKSSQTFLKHAVQDFADKFVCEYALHSAFQLKT